MLASSAPDQPAVTAPAAEAVAAAQTKPLKIESIQALRGLAVLLVLVRHLVVMEEHYGRNVKLLGDFFKVGDCGVDLFFVISGFVMVTVSKNLFQRAGALGTFLWKRAVRIYPLYWVYSLVILAVFLKFPQMVNSSQGSRVDMLASFFLWPQLIMPLLGQGWTLTFELYFYLVFALTLLGPARLLPLWLSLWAIVITVGSGLIRADVGFLQGAVARTALNPLALEFIVGCILALLTHCGWRRGGILCLGVGSLLLLAGTYFGDPMKIKDMRVAAFGVPAVLIVYGAVVLELARGFRFPRFFEQTGDASYSIYLSHVLVISTVGRLWRSVGRPALWENAVAIPIMFVAAVALGFASYRFLEQPLLRFFHTRQFRRAVPGTGPVPDAVGTICANSPTVL